MLEPTPNASPVHSGTPYFMGEHALIRFSSGESGYGPETYWLADKKTHTLRPFESETALRNAFGEGFDTAMKHVVTVKSPTVNPSGEITDGVLNDYNILSPEYSIKEDGSSKKLRFSPHQLRSRYGKPIDMNAEGIATEAVDGFLNLLKGKQSETGINAAFLNELKQDTHLMAFYISALAYGGYTLSDIYTDISRQFKQKNSGNK